MAKAARNIGRRTATVPDPVVANGSVVVAYDSGVVANGSPVVANGRAVAAGAFVTF